MKTSLKFSKTEKLLFFEVISPLLSNTSRRGPRGGGILNKKILGTNPCPLLLLLDTLSKLETKESEYLSMFVINLQKMVEVAWLFIPLIQATSKSNKKCSDLEVSHLKMCCFIYIPRASIKYLFTFLWKYFDQKISSEI